MQNKINRFLNRNNILTAAISVLLLVVLLLVISLSPATLYSAEKDVTRFSPDIVQGVICSFDINCEVDDLQSISLKFGTYGRNNNGSLMVSLSDTDGNIIEEWTYDCTKVKDLIYVDFPLTNPLTQCRGNTYNVTVTSTSDIDRGVCLCCTDDVINLDFDNSFFEISPCYILGYESTLSTFFACGSDTSRTLGILMVLLIAFVIPFAVRFVIKNFTKGKLLLMVLPFYLLFFSTHRIIEDSSVSVVSHKIYLLLGYALISVIWIITTMLAYDFILKKNMQLHIVAAVVLSVLSIVSILFNTPATVPDGDYHYGFAYQYSNYILGYATPFQDTLDDNGYRIIYMRDADAELILSATRTNSHCLSEDAYVAAANAFFNSDKNYDVHAYSVNDYLRTDMTFTFNSVFLSPVIPAIGITIGRALNLDALSTFYLGRLCNTIFFVLMAYFCIKIIPIGKNLMFVFFTIPMTIFLGSSLSYDGFTICICALFIAMLVKIMYQEDKMTVKQFIGLIAVAMILIPCKFVYAPLLVCCFAIPSEKIPLKHPVAFKRVLLGIMFVGCISIFLIPTFRVFYLIYIEPLLLRVGGGSYLGLLLGSFEMSTVTFFVKMEEILETMIFTAGWGQFYLPAFIYAIYYGILLVSASPIINEKSFLNSKDKALFTSMMVIVSILLALPLIMYKSPDEGDTLLGLNGRYFLCILPLLLLTFRPKLHLTEKVLKKADVLSVYMCFICWIYTLLNLFGCLNS